MERSEGASQRVGGSESEAWRVDEWAHGAGVWSAARGCVSVVCGIGSRPLLRLMSGEGLRG